MMKLSERTPHDLECFTNVLTLRDCDCLVAEIVQLEDENEVLLEYATHKKDCEVWNQTVRYFHDGEHDICDCGLDPLLTRKEG